MHVPSVVETSESWRTRHLPHLRWVGCLLALAWIGCDQPKSTQHARRDAGVTASLDESGDTGSTTDDAAPVGDVAMSSDDTTDTMNTETAGTGGSDENPPAVASAGSEASAMDDADAGLECTPLPKPIDTSSAPKCPIDVCPAQDSLCLPAANVGAFVSRATLSLLARCTDTRVCVPSEFAAQGGRGIQPSCTSLNGAEGRCTSSCIPEVALQSKLLPKDTCTGSNLCAPCFDPRTGADTLACRQGCDPGPKHPPKLFAHCCSDRGLCVPPALAGPQAKNLNKESCTGDTLCAPTELTDLRFKPKECASIDGIEGRCISTCVGGALGKQKDRLPKSSCGTDELCAPCFDPVTGEDTGACTINGDKPQQPGSRFARCCGDDVGVCVPPSMAGPHASMLRQESCAEGKLCAPITKAKDPDYKFPACGGDEMSEETAEPGACVPACLLNPFLSSLLTRSLCAENTVCAPCTLLGRATGACD